MPAAPLNNEQELLRSIAASNEHAFRLLFLHYKDRVYSYAMHFTQNGMVSEEIVQDVFLKAWKHRELLPGIEHFEAWIYTITRNHSISYMRKLANEEAARRNWSNSRPVSSALTDDFILNNEYQKLLQQAIEKLPPRQKLIYTLSRVEGLKHEAIAARLGISKNTVKVHMVKALESIRRHIDERLLFLLFLYNSYPVDKFFHND